MLIDEITFLDEIFQLEKKKEFLEHINITNVSYWNSSQSYKEYIEKFISLNYEQDIFDYVYTYDVSITQRLQIMKKLDVINPKESMCLLNATGTNSILNVINYLKLHNYKKIAILLPSYFSVERGCQIYNLAYEKILLHYSDGKYCIPYQYLLENHFDAIWLTSPAYSTGVSFDSFQIDILKKLISNEILVIADETLALPHQMLLTKIPISDFFFCICSPHKPLFINKIKFSALICPKRYDDFLEQWIDVLSGSLLSSNLVAIQHFLSDNYSECMSAAQYWYTDSINKIHEILQLFPNAQCNLDEISPYKTIYINNPSKNVKDMSCIKTIINNDCVSYIPATFGEYVGFRVNLSLEPRDLTNAIYRILSFYI